MSLHAFFNVHVSTSVTESVQSRVFPRRRAKSRAHHARMNKKWLKRYGTHLRPCCYIADTPDTGKVILIHPVFWPEYKRRSAEAGIELRFPYGPP